MYCHRVRHSIAAYPGEFPGILARRSYPAAFSLLPLHRAPVVGPSQHRGRLHPPTTVRLPELQQRSNSNSTGIAKRSTQHYHQWCNVFFNESIPDHFRRKRHQQPCPTPLIGPLCPFVCRTSYPTAPPIFMVLHCFQFRFQIL